MISPRIDSSPKSSAAASTSFDDQNQSETMNSTENAVFDNTMNDSQQAQDSSQIASPDRTSTPAPSIESNDQNHFINELRPPLTPSPGREKSPSWEQQQQTNTNSNSADNDAIDSEVSLNCTNSIAQSELIIFFSFYF